MSTVDVVSAIAKFAVYLGSLQAAGLAVFAGFFLGESPGTKDRVRRWVVLSVLVALFTTLVWLVLQPARMTGSFSGIADTGLLVLAWQTDGLAVVARLVGLTVLGWAAVRASKARVSTTIAAVLVTSSFTMSGHASGAGALAQAALAMHTAVAAFWIGSLPALIATMRVESPAVAARVVESFSAVATFVVPVLLLVGILLAWLIGATVDTLRLPYGRLLLAKAASFAALMALAGANKWRLGPRLSSGDARAVSRFEGSVALEYVLIAAVLAITATLTTFYSVEP